MIQVTSWQLFWSVVIPSGILLVVGAFLGHWCTNRVRFRYANPQLHEGRWVLGHVASNRDVSWIREGHDYGSRCHGNHFAITCTITSGLAHVDACVCGKTRYGVYGAWSS